MPLDRVYVRLGNYVKALLREEAKSQGHDLTHTMINSIRARSGTFGLEIEMIDYAKKLNDGVPSSDVNSTMIPGLIRYFILRGFPEPSAKIIAFKTFSKWKKEGISTVASSRFSETGERTHFIDNALNDKRIDEFLSTEATKEVEILFNEFKSETI